MAVNQIGKIITTKSVTTKSVTTKSVTTKSVTTKSATALYDSIKLSPRNDENRFKK